MEKTTPLEKEKVLEKIKNGEFKNVQTKKPKSVIQKEGKGHHEEVEKADKKVNIPEKVHKALEAKAKAEGKTVDEKAAEIVEAKAKTEFEGKINKYGFLHFSKDLMEALGWEKGVDIAVVIKKTDKGISVERA